MRPTCIDSFAGAGGLGLGLIRSGFELLYSFDIDEKSIETQRLNPKYFRHESVVLDIREFDSQQVMKKFNLQKGQLSLFAGGPPCQGFSIQRIGDDSDERNNYVFAFMEKTIELMPKFFLLENVPGINGKRGKTILQEALSFAEENGYHIHKQVLNAQFFGVPQRRKRMIIVGERISDGDTKFNFPKSNNISKTVRETISHLPVPPMNGKDHTDYKHHRRDKLSELNLRRIKSIGQGQGMQHLPRELLADCHKIGADKIGHRNVYGRMKWDDVAPTITARFDSFTRGLFGHPEQDRTITLREGALLQTFPEDFVFSGNKVDIAKQIGNAVPPDLAFQIGKEVLKVVK